jgi:lysophospholipase L1-like esterase
MKRILSPSVLKKFYIVVLHLVILVLIFKTNFLTVAGKTLGLVPTEEWNLSVLDQVLATAERSRKAPNGSVVLLGDSLIVNLGEPKWPVPALNAGLGGDTTRTLARRLATLQAIDHAHAWVVGVGVNDLKYRTPSTIAIEYEALLDRFPLDRPLFILGIFPVLDSGTAARSRRYLRNAAIEELNKAIRQQCERRIACQYLDTASIMKKTNGELDPANFQEDGWHLSQWGANNVHSVLAKLLGFKKPV